ncbi:DNA-binding protein [Aliiroseovarius sp. KMU-50]|uniref:DNA-binding protein n=1 Tax=Aliiroseovarius salicola TaxID=3009082 RepID=A0ABT4W3E9_9RHOB|nr:DNA-binding protein [Aliiroseovarius sp. KMU-50]MDA5095016.1 DNA-binding protein [Aliiroseovarius sp. KMU-50]
MNSTKLQTFLSKQAAADFLGVSVRTLDRRHAEGSGPPRIKHGAKIGYFHSSIIEWLKKLEKQPVRG